MIPKLSYGTICFLVFISNTLIAQESNVINNFNFEMRTKYFLFPSDAEAQYNDKLLDDFYYDMALNYSTRFITRDMSGLFALQGKFNKKEVTFDISEGWLKLILFPGLGISSGLKKVDWQEKIFGNPSNLFAVSNILDMNEKAALPLSIELFGSLPLFDLNIDFSVITFFVPVNKLELLPVFYSLSSIMYPFEFKIKGGFRKDKKPDWGMSIKFAFFLFDFVFDASWLKDSVIKYYKKNEDMFVEENPSGNDYFRIGLSICFSSPYLTEYLNFITFRSDFLYQSDGWSKENGDTFFNMIDKYDLLNEIDVQKYLVLYDSFSIINLYRYYLFSSIGLKGFLYNSIELGIDNTINLVDFSFNIGFRINFKLYRFFVLKAKYNYFNGETNTEFGSRISGHMIELSITRFF